MNQAKLPIGIESFEEIRKEGFYYIDKTGLIKDLLNNWGKVNLFTRPRRFGKTLNMSMLKSFFEIGADKTLFEGLQISKETELCEKYMGKYPVVFLTLKGVDGLTYEKAEVMLKSIIRTEAMRHYYLKSSERISEEDRDLYRAIIAGENTDIEDSLRLLSQLVSQHYGQKTIILIDEYDVPLDKAFHNGYYTEMIKTIRGLFEHALKTNEYLQFAVVTGCLRVSKESVFTGLNNFKVLSIVDRRFDEHFGFTDAEVKQLLKSYQLEQHFAEMKEWYDGYHFGNTDVYCPWDVINYVDHLCADPDAEPQAYWINTSGNAMVKRFVSKADKTTQREIEQLIAGEAIEKSIHLELTYEDIDKSINNLWSVLFTTGYLTHIGKTPNGSYKLVIPNREVREVFLLQIQEWFEQEIIEKEKTTQPLCAAFQTGDAEEVCRNLTAIMGRMISVLDTKARDEQKENFYHGLLLGLLRSEPTWLIMSNAESGEGFSDILVETDDPDAGLVIEVKYSPTLEGLEDACTRAMAQIKARRYDERLRNDGRNDIRAFGVAFWKKRCKVVCERL